MSKRYFFFDVETNGLPSSKTLNRPAIDAEAVNSTEYLTGYKDGQLGWPRIHQIGWVVTDGAGAEISSGVAHLHSPFASGDWEKQDGHPYEIDPVATSQGYDQRVYFPKVVELMNWCDTIVCHNLAFDSRIFEAEMVRLQLIDPATVMPPKKSEGKEKICTMRTTTRLLNLPYPSGKGSGKFPTLEELHTFLFGENFEGAHDALADVRATVRCFWELKRRGHYDEV